MRKINGTEIIGIERGPGEKLNPGSTRKFGKAIREFWRKRGLEPGGMEERIARDVAQHKRRNKKHVR